MRAPTMTNMEGTIMVLKISRQFYFRVWLGLKLMKLGARVTGMGLQVLEIDP